MTTTPRKIREASFPEAFKERGEEGVSAIVKRPKDQLKRRIGRGHF